MVYQPPKDKAVYNLDNTWTIVLEQLHASNIKQQCLKSGAVLLPDGQVQIKYLNDDYLISPSAGDVYARDRSFAVPLREKILILHYFLRATGAPPSGKQITYRDLPGGLVYYPTFLKRTIQPLIRVFGGNAAFLKEAGQSLGAHQGSIGDASLVIHAFPRVPIQFILWEGDNELAPELNLLLDANILDYLESEDVTITCEIITWRLINAVRQQK